MESGGLESSNINSLWLMNIYENIKNSENMIRLGREGCLSLLDYLNFKQEDKNILLADIQYKNLKMLRNELSLLVGDLSPVIKDNAKTYYLLLENMEKVINNRVLFIKEIKDKDNRIVVVKLTPFFEETMKHLEEIRRRLIIEISPILYLKEDDINQKKW